MALGEAKPTGLTGRVKRDYRRRPKAVKKIEYAGGGGGSSRGFEGKSSWWPWAHGDRVGGGGRWPER